nr:immunoglobulin light chain junction region [Macaca mulatta]
CQHYNGDLLTF